MLIRISPSADSRRAVVSYWQKYVDLGLVNCLGGLSLARNNVVRLTDITIDVYRGRIASTNNNNSKLQWLFRGTVSSPPFA